MRANQLEKWISEKVNTHGFVLFDGAMGTELERLGFEANLPLWSARANDDAPQLVKKVHQSYLDAGSDFLTANSFRSTEYTFAKTGSRELARNNLFTSVNLAKACTRSFANPSLLAGSIAPLENCFHPEQSPPPAKLREQHQQTVSWLAEAGCDFILAETMGRIDEAVIIAEACHSSGLAWMMSFRSLGNGRLTGGEDLTDAIAAIADLGPSALLVNCGSPGNLTRDLEILLDNFEGIKGIYANAPGQFAGHGQWTYPGDPVAQYSAYCKRWLEMGAELIGGCCGTTPEMIGRLHQIRTNTIQ